MENNNNNNDGREDKEQLWDRRQGTRIGQKTRNTNRKEDNEQGW